MKTHSNQNLLVRSSLALALAVAFWSPVQAQAAEPAMTEAKMMDQCKEMMAKKQKMMEDSKAQDAEITAHVAKMNSMPDDKKVAEIAAVLTHLVEQRSTMNARKAVMEAEMMAHMMQHMQMGKESMSMCPMMKGMKGMPGMDGKAADASKVHHE